jgi:hypothetical protein
MTKQPNHWTWTGFMPTGIMVIPRSEALRYARLGYEQMRRNNPTKFAISSDGTFERTMLVACLYVPRKGYFLGTNPGADGFGRVNGGAPAWWEQVKDRQVTTVGRSKWHAEDVAMVEYEKSLTTKLAAGDAYPAGSIMAVYGHYMGETPGPNAPGRKSVCGQGNGATMNPSCYTVLHTALNVEV